MISSTTLWYLTRATGIVSLVLLSVTVALGIATFRRVETATLPRFAVAELHRSLALISVVFLGVHIVTAVSDPFAPIGWIASVVPFSSSYRRLWLGLGTVSVDLLLAVIVTSLLREKISQRYWRAVHWLTYLSWPIAVFHALGTGTDVPLGWFLFLLVLCVAGVFFALIWRLCFLWPLHAKMRAAAAGASAVVITAGVLFAAFGPLRAGWAARAGTPTLLLGRPAARPLRGGSSSKTTASGGPGASSALSSPPYTTNLRGTVTTTALAEGEVRIVLAATTSAPESGRLLVTLIGPTDGSGGVAVRRSSASFGPASDPRDYTGQLSLLSGSSLSLSLHSLAGTALYLNVNLVLDNATFTGSLHASSTPT